MKFIRTDEYEAKLFEQALFDEKHVIRDAKISIVHYNGKLKAYCHDTDTFLQFPRNLRSEYSCAMFKADVVEVIRNDGVAKYYRAMKGSIRFDIGDEVLG